MKYIIVLGDGMADVPKGPLAPKTPLDLAVKPNIDKLAKDGEVGMIATVDAGLKPGSDVANLSVLGYDPKECYTGRSPLEALSIGIDLDEDDVCMRTNLVTFNVDPYFSKTVLTDYSAGEISTEESALIFETINEKLGTETRKFYTGVSYRNCLLLKHRKTVDATFTPPHDIQDKEIGPYLPQGKDGEEFASLIEKSVAILAKHPVNLKRIEEGKRPASAIWFWGMGTKPKLQSLYERYGLTGAMISATDLLCGIGKGIGMDVIHVEGATGTLRTNFMGKAEAAVKALEDHDFVYVHFEAPDECGHQGDAPGKIKSIEKIDEVVGYIRQKMEEKGEPFVLAVLPDHQTPLYIRTHVGDPVPFIVYNSLHPAHCGLTYSERTAEKGVFLDNGRALMKLLIQE